VKDVVAGLDRDAAVAAQSLHEFFDAPSGLAFEPSADREGGEHDGEVGFDGVAFVVVDGPGSQVGSWTCGSSSRSATAGGGRPSCIGGRGLQVRDVALQPGQGTRFGLQVTVDALGATGELDEPVPPDRRLPGDGLLR
jgi:hypothetical protein